MLNEIFKTRNEYFEYDALDYSYLKAFEQNPNAPRKSNISGPGVTFGSALDCLLFDGREEFERQYMFLNEQKPTASLLTLYESVMQDLNDSLIISSDDVTFDYLVNKVFTLGLWSNITDRKKLEMKFTPDFMMYLTKSIDNKDKTILDANDYYKVGVANDYILANKYTRDYFNTEKYEVLTQLAFSFTNEDYEPFELKAMLDLVCIDHKNKTIQPVDLKTMSDPPFMFKSNVIKYKYYLQAELYSKAMNEYKEYRNLKDYTILPFKFIVVSSMEEYFKIPYVYTLSSWFTSILRDTSAFNVKSIDEILMDYKVNTEYGFDYPAEMYVKGSILL